jgi:L-ribulose-5-phosphate 3-epimerase UlaE
LKGIAQAMPNKPDETERIEQLATQVMLLIQFAATMVDDTDLLEKVEKQSSEISSSTLTLAPILGAVGADYEEAHMEAEVKRKRAAAITNLVRTLKDTESEREDFKSKQASK